MKLKCKCKHEEQDRLHGEGMRIHNKVNKTSTTQYRCTVCGNIRTEK